MFLVDTQEGRIVSDDKEVKQQYALAEHPYGQWLKDNDRGPASKLPKPQRSAVRL